MTYTEIPDAWSVGNESIDKEHQQLLNLLHSHQHDEASAAGSFFNEFFTRFSSLIEKRVAHMETKGAYNLEYSKNEHEKSLKFLVGLNKDTPSMCNSACRSALLREISDADLYYNNPVNK